MGRLELGRWSNEAEGRKQMTEDRKQRTDDRIQRTEYRGQRTEYRGQKTNYGCRKSDCDVLLYALCFFTRNPQLVTRNP